MNTAGANPLGRQVIRTLTKKGGKAGAGVGASLWALLWAARREGTGRIPDVEGTTPRPPRLHTKQTAVRRLWPQRTLFALLLPALTPAAAQSFSLVVNGQPAPARAIVVGGQTYVPLSALKSLGISSSLSGMVLTLGTGAAPSAAPGGANQRASLEGCVGETLFNGVWRMTVKSVTPISRFGGQNRGYALNIEWKNGTKTAADALNSGVKGFQLILRDGTALDSENVQDLQYRKLAQGAGNTFTLNFYADSAQSPRLTPADKLLVEIDPGVLSATGLKVAYTTPTPSFRVRLGCTG